MEIKFLKIKKNFRKENPKINPEIYWKVVIILAFLLMIASFIFAYNLFVETNKDDFQAIENNNVQTGNKEKTRIENALEYFSLRAKKSNEILNSPTSIVDPSL